jgi:hypothetical protein
VPEELADWEAITPALLRPAIKHIRDSKEFARVRFFTTTMSLQ